MHPVNARAGLLSLKTACAAMALLGCLWVGAAQANADSLYGTALESIEAREYTRALADLRRLQKNYPGFKHLAAAQTRIAVLQESADAGESLPVFLHALTLRDRGQIDAALAALDVIAQADPAGTLTDDALYISAYLLVMDRYDFVAARVALRTLLHRFPDSAYTDSAAYLDAIAMEQLGDTEGARQALVDLRERHTVLSLPLGFRWPAGTVLSRYWFDRADRRLAIVKQRIASASTVSRREEADDGSLQLAVNVDGVDMRLSLIPSPLTRTTQWLDAGLGNHPPPSIGVFDGTVQGIANSWVRVVLQNGYLTGVVNIDGTQKRLTPANLMGTLDYYQPRTRRRTVSGEHSDLADSVQGLDALIAPPQETGQLGARSRTIQTDVRAVPISIVVDSQYDRYYGGAGLAHALNNLNVADGVYRQFGLALTLDEALRFDEADDPLRMGAVPLESILRSFRDYRLQYKTLFEDSALSYLFTGNPKTDITLGLAWIDTACRADGYDVGVTTPSDFGDVLLTHELGHSFGAQHDSDTQCSNDNGSIMWPNISARTDTSFTSCSQQSVLGARAKVCLLNSVDLGLSANASGTTVSFTISNPDSTLSVSAQLVIETSAPDQLQWPAGCQAQTPTSANCQVNAITAGQSRTLDFVVNADFQNSDAPVTGQVAPLGTMELQSSNNLATVSLLSGASSDHLIVPQNPVQAASDGVLQSNSEPVTGAASGGGAIHWLECLLFVLAGLFRAALSLLRARETINYPLRSPLHPAQLRCSSVE